MKLFFILLIILGLEDEEEIDTDWEVTGLDMRRMELGEGGSR